MFVREMIKNKNCKKLLEYVNKMLRYTKAVSGGARAPPPEILRQKMFSN